MRKVELIALSEKADTIVAEYGTIWQVVKSEDFRVFVKPYSLTSVTKPTARWIEKDTDEHFHIEEYNN
jgi:glucuronate isomerase